MIRKKLSINSVDKVKKFCDAASRCIADIDVISDRYVIDGKSIMGLFSLDLSKTLELIVHADDENEKTVATFFDAIKDFIVE